MRSFKMTRHCPSNAQPTSYQDDPRCGKKRRFADQAQNTAYCFEVIQSMPNLEVRRFLGRQACFFPRMRGFAYRGRCWRMLKVPGAPRFCEGRWGQKSEIKAHHQLYCMCSRDHVQRWLGHSSYEEKVCYHSAPFCAWEACKVKERSNQRNHALSWLYCCCMLLHVVGVGGLACINDPQ